MQIVGDDQEEKQPALIDDEEDEQYLEEMERFEAAYNFRCETAWLNCILQGFAE